jgi:hypothetical protein
MQERIDSYYKFCQRLLKDIQPKSTALIIVDMLKYKVQKDFIVYKAMDNINPGILDYIILEVEKNVTLVQLDN